MTPDTVERVRLPLTSVASDVRASARENSRRSLHFFLTAVVGVRVDVETCSTLQRLPLRALLRLAFGIRLWCLIRNVVPDAALENSEAIRWLFPDKV